MLYSATISLTKEGRAVQRGAYRRSPTSASLKAAPLKRSSVIPVRPSVRVRAIGRVVHAPAYALPPNLGHQAAGCATAYAQRR
jgi:hypothetical protein